MRALVFDRELSFLRDLPVPEPAEGEALIRVRLAGICSTDLEILNGYARFTGVPGHEFVGTVEQGNGIPPDLINRRVVGEINIGCGRCRSCRSGVKEHCRERKVLGIRGKDGAFAEYLTLPFSNLHPVPDAVSDQEAVFAEPLAAGFRVAGQVRFEPGQRVVVLGDGKLGLLIAAVLSGLPVDLTLAGRHEAKLRVAREWGVRTAPVSELGPGVIPEPLVRGEFDVVVDATGSAEGFEAALTLVRPRGTLVLKSTIAEQHPIDLSPVVVNEITVLGSRCGPFGPAIEALADKRINVSRLVSAIYPPEEFAAAFREAKKKDSLKIMLDFGKSASTLSKSPEIL